MKTIRRFILHPSSFILSVPPALPCPASAPAIAAAGGPIYTAVGRAPPGPLPKGEGDAHARSARFSSRRRPAVAPASPLDVGDSALVLAVLVLVVVPGELFPALRLCPRQGRRLGLVRRARSFSRPAYSSFAVFAHGWPWVVLEHAVDPGGTNGCRSGRLTA